MDDGADTNEGLAVVMQASTGPSPADWQSLRVVNTGTHPEQQGQSITRPRQQDSDVSD